MDLPGASGVSQGPRKVFTRFPRLSRGSMGLLPMDPGGSQGLPGAVQGPCKSFRGLRGSPEGSLGPQASQGPRRGREGKKKGPAAEREKTPPFPFETWPRRSLTRFPRLPRGSMDLPGASGVSHGAPRGSPGASQKLPGSQGLPRRLPGAPRPRGLPRGSQGLPKGLAKASGVSGAPQRAPRGPQASQGPHSGRTGKKRLAGRAGNKKTGTGKRFRRAPWVFQGS